MIVRLFSASPFRVYSDAMENLSYTFGRGTPAGKAIHHCYAKPSKPSTLDPKLAAALAQRRAERESAELAISKPKPIPKSQTRIRRPRVGLQVSTSSGSAENRLKNLPHRRPRHVIEATVKEESGCCPAPQYERPPITEAEKDRLAQIMQYGQELPEVTVLEGVHRARVRKLDKRLELRDRFNRLLTEASTLRKQLAEIHRINNDGKGSDEARYTQKKRGLVVALT